MVEMELMVGAPTRTARRYKKEAPHRGKGQEILNVERDRALHRRSASVRSSEGAFATAGPIPIKVDRVRALMLWLDSVRRSRGAVATAHVDDGAQGGGTAQPPEEGEGEQTALASRAA